MREASGLFSLVLSSSVCGGEGLLIGCASGVTARCAAGDTASCAGGGGGGVGGEETAERPVSSSLSGEDTGSSNASGESLL